MKRLKLLLLLLIICSCKKYINEKTNSFDGIGELKIGTNFDSLHSSKNFKKESFSDINNEKLYSINKYELPNNMGIVEDLNVRTSKGKIYLVSFYTGKYTNQQSIRNYIELGSKANAENSEENFISNDSRIFSDITYYTENESYGQKTYKTFFIYYNISENQEIRYKSDSINLEKQKIINKKIKEDYMMDLKK